MKFCYNCMEMADEKAKVCPHCGEPFAEKKRDVNFLRPGTRLQNKFIVGNPIGSGGFGKTYIGWNETLQCKVAIKEYFPIQYSRRDEDGVTVTVSDSSMNQRYRIGLQQFLEEARSVAGLQDIIGVVAIYSFFEENGTGYIVMEYLEGMDVKTILKKHDGRRDYEWVRRVVLTVLYTLREIHDRGVLHRDIAPDNIFVTNEGIIKLIDFGAAKHASEIANMKAEIVLKVGYAPIEQYSRKTAQGAYTDLYATAALMYRMLTGQKPAPANERMQNEHLPTPTDLGISIPEQAEMGMMVCLNVQPEYRLQSAEEFMEALDGLDFIPVYEPEWILPPDEPEHRNWFMRMSVGARAAIVLLFIAVLGTGAGVTIYSLTRTDVVETGGKAKKAHTMMKLVGLPYSELDTALKENGIEINDIKVTFDYSDTDEERISWQETDEGEDIPDSLKITVTGNKRVTLKNQQGEEWSAAERYFKDKGIKNVKYAAPSYDNKYKIDQVSMVQIDETDGVVDLEKTDTVTLVRSLGKKSDYTIALSRKDYRGKSQSQIEDIILKKLLKKPSLQGADDKIKASVKKNLIIKKKTGSHVSGVSVGKVTSVSKKKFSLADKVKITLTINDSEPTPEPEPERTQSDRRNSESSSSAPKRQKSKPQKRKSGRGGDYEVVDVF